MTWLSKSELLASEQGLEQLNEGFLSRSKTWKRILICLLVALVTFSSTTGLLYLIGVQNLAIKWPIAIGLLLIGFLVTCGYFTFFQHG